MTPEPTWWTDDRILAFVGILVSAAALLVGLWIAQEQDKAQDLFSRKVLGSVPNIDFFKERLCDLIKSAEMDERSHIYLMLYWLWFGADRCFPKHQIDFITEGRSDVGGGPNLLDSQTGPLSYKPGYNIR